MLHSIKVAFSVGGQRAFVDADIRIRDADLTLTELQRFFPKLEKHLLENGHFWTSVGTNVVNISRTAQEAYGHDHPMYPTLHLMYEAGDRILRPIGSQYMKKELGIGIHSLRSFNDSVRQCCVLHRECVNVLRNRRYYAQKVEVLYNKEKKASRSNDKDAIAKRSRNEAKLNDFENKMAAKLDQLQSELTRLLAEKNTVLSTVIATFVRSQQLYFDLNPFNPVKQAMKEAMEEGALKLPSLVTEDSKDDNENEHEQASSSADASSSSDHNDVGTHATDRNVVEEVDASLSSSTPSLDTLERKVSQRRNTVAGARSPGGSQGHGLHLLNRDLSDVDEFGRKSMDRPSAAKREKHPRFFRPKAARTFFHRRQS